LTAASDNAKAHPLYRSLVGALIHIARTTRPDIMYHAHFLARFVNCSDISHWNAAIRVLTYLYHNDYHIVYRASPAAKFVLHGYSDSDWLGDFASTTNGYSTSGNILFLGTSPITWSSSKQTVVAMSSAEAELIAAVGATQELIGIRRILTALKFFVDNSISSASVDKDTISYIPDKSSMYVDNQSAIAIAQHGSNSKRTRHFTLNYHFLRDWFNKKLLTYKYVSSKQNIADMFTKNINGPLLRHLLSSFVVH
jgi:hypothetical protein